MAISLNNINSSTTIDLSVQHPFKNVSGSNNVSTDLVGLKIDLQTLNGDGFLTALDASGRPRTISERTASDYFSGYLGKTGQIVYSTLANGVPEDNLWQDPTNTTGAILYYIPDPGVPYYQIVGTMNDVNDLLQNKLVFVKQGNWSDKSSIPITVTYGVWDPFSGLLYYDNSMQSSPRTVSPVTKWTEQGPVLAIPTPKVAVAASPNSQTVFSAVTLTDENYYDPMTVTVAVSSGSFKYNGTTYTNNSSTPLTLTGNGAAALQSQLRSLAVTVDQTQDTTFTLTATDAAGQSASKQLTIHNNQAPMLSGTMSSPTFTIGGASVSLFGSMTVSDDPIDSNDVDTLTVTISSNYTSGDSIASSGGSGSYDAATHTYTYTYIGTVAQIQTTLKNMTFTATSLGSGDRTISASIKDSLGATLATPVTTDVAVVELYRAPSISVTATELDYNDTVERMNPFSQVTITGSGTVMATLTIPQGFGFSALTSGSPGVGVTVANNTITLTGTSGDITTYLQRAGSITVAIPQNTISLGTTQTDTFGISATNTGGSGSATNTQSVKITPVDDAPTVMFGLITPGPVKTIKDSETVKLIYNGATVTDPDAGDTETVTVQLNGGGSGANLHLAAGSGLTGITEYYNSATGIYTCSNLTAAQASVLLNNLEFIPQASANPQFVSCNVTITDSQNQSFSQSNVTSFSITHDTTHDLRITQVPASISIDDDRTANNLFSGIQLSGGSANSSLTINNGDPSKGVFSLASDASFQSQVSIGPQGKLTLKGTGVQIQADLQSGNILFQPVANLTLAGDSSTDAFTITSSDTPSLNSSMSVRITSINDTPVLSQILATQSVQNTGTLALCPQATLTDPDFQETEAITVTVTGEGTISASQSATASSSGTGAGTTRTYSWNSMSVAAAQTLLRSLSYHPVAGQTSAATVQIQTKDGSNVPSLGANITVSVTAASSGGSGGSGGSSTDSTPTDNYSGSTTAQEVNLMGSENRNIVGGAGDDVFRGNSGNNVLDGGSGNNQLWGAAGDDKLIGGSGSNGYWWAQNNGHDIVQQAGNNSGDALYFSNISRGGYILERQANDLVLTIADGSSLTVSDWYGMDAKARIQGWVFGRTAVAWNDGEEAIVDLAKPCYAQLDMHIAIGSAAGNSILRGSGGDDVLLGGIGGSQMWSGAGNDVMTGGSGKDEYWWGSSDDHDVITSRADNSQDSIMLYNTPLSSIHSQLSGNDLVISLDGSSDTLTIQDWARGGGYQLNSFNIGGKMYQVAADGKSWSAK
ncbi:MAG: calcium-binding protein [Sporomusaceae bacterium]|nr:calcium-binding protein [Sporomusaceae bacterium]